jgi:hypothetical protein
MSNGPAVDLVEAASVIDSILTDIAPLYSKEHDPELLENSLRKHRRQVLGALVESTKLFVVARQTKIGEAQDLFATQSREIRKRLKHEQGLQQRHTAQTRVAYQHNLLAQAAKHQAMVGEHQKRFRNRPRDGIVKLTPEQVERQAGIRRIYANGIVERRQRSVGEKNELESMRRSFDSLRNAVGQSPKPYDLKKRIWYVNDEIAQLRAKLDEEQIAWKREHNDMNITAIDRINAMNKTREATPEDNLNHGETQFQSKVEQEKMRFQTLIDRERRRKVYLGERRAPVKGRQNHRDPGA